MGQLAIELEKKNNEWKKWYLQQRPQMYLENKNRDKRNKYYQLLTNFDFIYLKIQHPKLGVESLIRDYGLIYDPEILDNLEEDEKLEPEQVKTLKLIQRALQLSAHILNEDKTQLVGQLWGRLQGFQQPDIQKILSDGQQSKSEIPRFRPITASLTTPDGNLLRTFTGHKGRVLAVAIAPDGKTAVSASDDKTLKHWNLHTGEEISTFTGHKDWVQAVAIAPDGKTAVSASFDNTLKQWDLHTGEEISTFTGHKDWVTTVAIAPDGKTAVSASFDNTLKLWDLHTGEEISTFTGHKDWVTAAAIAPDGKTAVSGSYDKTLKLWDLHTGEEISTFTGHKGRVQAVAIAPDGKTAVSASVDNTLKQWDLHTGEQISTFTGHKHWVTAVAIAPDGKTAVSASRDKTLKQWDLHTGEQISTFTGHNRGVQAVAITPDGKTAVSASDDKTLKQWDLHTREQISTFTGHKDWVTVVAIAPDGKTAVSASLDKTLKQWDLHTGEEISTFTGHNGVVQAVAIAPDGKTAVSASFDNTLKQWDLHTGEEISTFTGDMSINCCAFSPDGLTIIAGEKSGTVHFLRLEGGSENEYITQNTINIPRYPAEFQEIITSRNHNFVGREFVFATINNFLNQYDRGYFTIIGEPGIGKSAILAHYVSQNPGIVYYNVEISGKNRVQEFLTTTCTQLIEIAQHQGSKNLTSNLTDSATENSSFLSLLLQKISDRLHPKQRLIITIDGCDRIDINNQPQGSNIFYLPRYLPEKVYFILTRRPFLTEKSGLLIETPAQSLDLSAYPQQNRADIQKYISHSRNNLREQNHPQNLSLNITKPSFDEDETNFMYVKEILATINQDIYPPNLQHYYQNHLEKMNLATSKQQPMALQVLNLLIQHQSISIETIAEKLDADEYEIKVILDKWREFLHLKSIATEIHYSLYHPSFRDWLKQQIESKNN